MTEPARRPRYAEVQDDLIALSERPSDRHEPNRCRDTPWDRAFRRGRKANPAAFRSGLELPVQPT